MQVAKDFLKEHKIIPFISFKDGKSHTVKILNAKQDTIKATDGNMVEGIKCLVEEDGDQKSFFTSSVDLITKLSNREFNDVVTIEMKSRKGEDGKWKSYYEMKEPQPIQSVNPNDIPVVEDNVPQDVLDQHNEGM